MKKKEGKEITSRFISSGGAASDVRGFPVALRGVLLLRVLARARGYQRGCASLFFGSGREK